MTVAYICYLTNIVTYSAFTMGLPLMTKENFITSEDRSQLLSQGMIGFIVGKVISGYIVDKLGPNRVVCASLAVVAWCMLTMAQASSVR